MRAEVEMIVQALNEAGVRYVVVGGVAVVLHGYLRATIDLDLVVQLEPRNVERALAVFETLGFVPAVPAPLSGFADTETRESWIRDKGMMVFSLWQPDHPEFRVGIFVSEPFDFEGVHSRAERMQLTTTEAVVVGLDDLIELKRGSDRHLDLADAEYLEQLRRLAEEAEDDDG